MRRALALVVVVLVGLTGLAVAPLAQLAEAESTRKASGFTIFMSPAPAPVCSAGYPDYTFFHRGDCGFIRFDLSGTDASSNVEAVFLDEAGDEAIVRPATRRTSAPFWTVSIAPDGSWPAGRLTVRVRVVGEPLAEGSAPMAVNLLGATVAANAAPSGGAYSPGEEVALTGRVFQIDEQPPLVGTQESGVAATFSLEAVSPTGQRHGPYGPFTAGSDGSFTATLPAAASAGLTAGPDTDYEFAMAVNVIDATYTDVKGDWAANLAGSGAVVFRTPPQTAIVENSFVSDVGWVKPGESYPSRVFVKNHTDEPITGAQVRLEPVTGMRFLTVTPAAGSGAAVIESDGAITWTVGDVPAATEAGPAIKTLVVQARARTLGEEPTVVWRDVSTVASLNYAGGPSGITSKSKGPKVIPDDSRYETSRFGFRPFPVVPVDYAERKHDPAHHGNRVSEIINSPALETSMFSLFQEMSFGQLHPNGKVPSAGIATADWTNTFTGRHKDTGFAFTDPVTTPLGAPLGTAGGTCRGTTLKESIGTPLLPQRIENGWYQLPGTTDYYGDDADGALSLTGFIDQACGPATKAVYDAAHIADPEIDYSDYDTDKDGVVDFFMMVYTGLGGHGASQTQGVPPYDNIWPHSWSLEATFVDPVTKLRGYISDDQLKDLEGRPLYYVDDTYTTMTTTETERPVWVRVGPYNVNPESAVDRNSVIAHEYGHSLGLPDFYSRGTRQTYGDWNLMGTDKAQHMDIFSKQEMGWIVPREISLGAQTVSGWQDSKVDTHRIDWVRPDGTPYTLAGPDVHNGEAYVARLPGRTLIDPAKVASSASPNHVWWSGQGNRFGCPPEAGRNLDIVLPELGELPEGTPVKLTFKSFWLIEWDFDYGFVMLSHDGGQTYKSLPSEKGYTEADYNPNHNENAEAISGGECQARYGNGITGASDSYANGTQDEDRGTGLVVTATPQNYPSEGPFREDEYDLTEAAGKMTTLRFSYSTDAATTQVGWFIDDAKITVGEGDDARVIWENDFEGRRGLNDPRVFNGGCRGPQQSANVCTGGWTYLDVREGSQPDHAYYMELRDRSGFDVDGRGQNDRGPFNWEPGLLLTYTDEFRGYGNVRSTGAPAQSPLDSTPQPEDDTPELDDAAFIPFAGRSHYSDFGEGHVDNYFDPDSDDGAWHFAYDCLQFDVRSMSGRDIGPLQPPYNLTADVDFTRGAGCIPFDYGVLDLPNRAPIPVADAKPNQVGLSEPIRFSGSESYDDLDPSSSLSYAWDFDGNGTDDATGVAPVHSYSSAGTYDVRLRVTDTHGASATDTVTVTVREDRGLGDGDGGDPTGYWLGASDGGLFAFGDAGFFGSMGGSPLNKPVTALASTPSGQGYWLGASDGGIFAFGDAGFFGSTGAIRLNQPIVGMSPTPDGQGYWLVASDGGIFAFGSAKFLGSTGNIELNQPIVGMAATPSGNGYWLVASDGGIFAFGDAGFLGSTGNIELNQPIVGMSPTPDGQGYWLVASDGGIFAFGSAKFLGSTGAIRLNQPIVGMTTAPSGNGYWLVASDGGIFAFGAAPFLGSTGATRLNQPIVGMDKVN